MSHHGFEQFTLVPCSVCRDWHRNGETHFEAVKRRATEAGRVCSRHGNPQCLGCITDWFASWRLA